MNVKSKMSRKSRKSKTSEYLIDINRQQLPIEYEQRGLPCRVIMLTGRHYHT